MAAPAALEGMNLTLEASKPARFAYSGSSTATVEPGVSANFLPARSDGFEIPLDLSAKNAAIVRCWISDTNLTGTPDSDFATATAATSAGPKSTEPAATACATPTLPAPGTILTSKPAARKKPFSSATYA